MEKQCTRCLTLKSLDDFHNCFHHKDGKTTICKSCVIEQAKQYYKHNKSKTIERANAAIVKLRNIVNIIKESYGCCFCGEKHPVCLDFHHPNLDKDDNVAQCVMTKNKVKIINEINKCIVICSNCHRKLHFGILDCANKPLCVEVLEKYFKLVGTKWYFKVLPAEVESAT